MIYLDAIYRLADTDIAAHLGCHHLAQLEARAVRCKLKPPQYYDPTMTSCTRRVSSTSDSISSTCKPRAFFVTSLPEHKATPVDTPASMRQGADIISRPLCIL